MKRLLINNAFPEFSMPLKEELDRCGVLKMWKSGDMLITEGQRFGCVTLILSGCVQLVRITSEGTEFALGFLQDGQSFGDTICDDSSEKDKTSIMTVKALELTYVLQVSLVDKDVMAKKYDQWYKYILKTAVWYYWTFVEVIDSVAFQKLDRRIENYLQRLSRLKNSPVLSISHQEIAHNLNASRETVSRLLKKMEETGRIQLRHNTIELVH